MPVTNNPDRSEEVTKHSVHTLVFRSQKRTHDMFISDQGALPALDPKAVDLSRRIKARATYGPIMEAVERNKKRQKATGIDHSTTLALTHEGAPINESTLEGSGGEGALNTNSELALYQQQSNPSGLGSNASGMPNAGGTNSQVRCQGPFML